MLLLQINFACLTGRKPRGARDSEGADQAHSHHSRGAHTEPRARASSSSLPQPCAAANPLPVRVHPRLGVSAQPHSLRVRVGTGRTGDGTSRLRVGVPGRLGHAQDGPTGLWLPVRSGPTGCEPPTPPITLIQVRH